jgi:small subunit ribosomal protein S17
MPKKEKKGIVVSASMQKTIVVSIVENRPHTKYNKIQKRTIKFAAHDELNQASVGQQVIIQESRPYSKTKCWRLIEICSPSVEDVAVIGDAV